MKTSLYANVQLNRSNFDFNLKSSLTPFFHRALQLLFIKVKVKSGGYLPNSEVARDMSTTLHQHCGEK